MKGGNATAWSQRQSLPGCQLGLHIALTWTPQSGSSGLLRFIVENYLKQAKPADIQQQIEQQLDHFEDLIGSPPSFVDGHQHVHALPIVRHCLLTTLRRRYPLTTRPPIRSIRSESWRGPKAWLLNWLGGEALSKALAAERWPTNTDFAGVYSLSASANFRALMRGWLKSINDYGMIMVHPGDGALSEHGSARAAESRYLASSQWQEDREVASVALTNL